ncbi:MAG: response regulator [Polyangiaceae bacterium]
MSTALLDVATTMARVLLFDASMESWAGMRWGRQRPRGRRSDPRDASLQSGGTGDAPRETGEVPVREADGAPRLSRQARILVAEDDDEMRRLVAEALRKDGYDVLAISDGRQLLSALAGDLPDRRGDSHWDLVVSDVRMPGPSGLRILEQVRAARWQIPFILMTAFGDTTMHVRARALGAVLFDKPFDVTKLRTAVASLLWRVS